MNDLFKFFLENNKNEIENISNILSNVLLKLDGIYFLNLMVTRTKDERNREILQMFESSLSENYNIFGCYYEEKELFVRQSEPHLNITILHNEKYHFALNFRFDYGRNVVFHSIKIQDLTSLITLNILKKSNSILVLNNDNSFFDFYSLSNSNISRSERKVKSNKYISKIFQEKEDLKSAIDHFKKNFLSTHNSLKNILKICYQDKFLFDNLVLEHLINKKDLKQELCDIFLINYDIVLADYRNLLNFNFYEDIKVLKKDKVTKNKEKLNFRNLINVFLKK